MKGRTFNPETLVPVEVVRLVNPVLAREQRAELQAVAASLNLSHLAPQARSEQQPGHRR